MRFKKYYYSFCLLFSLLAMAEDGWVQVVRDEKIIHKLQEEDRSIWVALAKVFGSERALVRFPEEPSISNEKGCFRASLLLEGGEMSMTVYKKELEDSFRRFEEKNLFYRDSESSLLVRERQIETEGYLYILSIKHPSGSSALYNKFFKSFEIERMDDFKRRHPPS